MNSDLIGQFSQVVCLVGLSLALWGVSSLYGRSVRGR